MIVASGKDLAIALRRRVAWPHPEWWALALSAAAWLALARSALVVSPGGDFHHAAASHPGGLVAASRDWMLMTLAMMVPLSIGAIQATADRSLWRRRHRAIAGWLVGYAALWLLVGVAIWFATTLLAGPTSSSKAAAAIAFLLAAAWQFAPARARALARCHHTQPIAPAGWRADYDCVRYGWTMGVWCSMTCGLLMAACSLTGHGLPGAIVMAGATMIGLAERYIVRPDPLWLAAPIAMMGVMALMPIS